MNREKRFQRKLDEWERMLQEREVWLTIREKEIAILERETELKRRERAALPPRKIEMVLKRGMEEFGKYMERRQGKEKITLDKALAKQVLKEPEKALAKQTLEAPERRGSIIEQAVQEDLQKESTEELLKNGHTILGWK